MGGTGLGVCVYFESTFYRPIQDSLQIFIEAEDQYLSFINLKIGLLQHYTVHLNIKTECSRSSSRFISIFNNL